MGKVSYKKVSFFVVVLLISLVISYFFSCDLMASENASEFIGVIFSILAASLFAVISIIGDPSMLLPGGARSAWVSAKDIQREIQQFNLLFILYLIVLGLLVVCAVVKDNKEEKFFWLFHLLTFFSCFGFLVSLAIPFSLAGIQRRRLEQEIQSRRRDNGGRDGRS